MVEKVHRIEIRFPEAVYQSLRTEKKRTGRSINRIVTEALTERPKIEADYALLWAIACGQLQEQRGLAPGPETISAVGEELANLLMVGSALAKIGHLQPVRWTDPAYPETPTVMLLVDEQGGTRDPLALLEVMRASMLPQQREAAVQV